MNKISHNDLMNHSFVISIDNKRLEQFNKLFSKHGLVLPKVFHGITSHKQSYVNCCLSHRGAIEYAKKNDFPYVCIFEDDAYPIKNICDEIDYYLSDIPNDIACLLLGDSKTLSSVRFNDRFNTKIMCYGAQSYVVFRDYYDKYIQCLDQFKYADFFAVPNEQKTIIKPDKFFMVNKPLFIQYCSKKSMNGHIGYCYRNPKGRNLTQEEIFNMGFEEISNIL